jgi:tetratricopeptide (TPR) repeat protein
MRRSVDALEPPGQRAAGGAGSARVRAATADSASSPTAELEAAAGLLRQSLEANPNDGAAHRRYGDALRRLGRFEEALASFERALEVCAGDAESHFSRGVALQFLGRLEEALEAYTQALGIAPGIAEIYYNRGIALQDLGRVEASLEAFGQAINLRPTYADAYVNRANLLSRLGRLEEALGDLERARSLKPDSAELHINLGNVLRRLGRCAEARESCERAVRIKPEAPEAHLNHGAVLYDMNEPQAAVECYDRALALRPDFAAAHQNRAYALLLQGDFVRGWPEHEWRWRNDHDPLWNERLRFAEPPWLGGESLAGKRILLHAEQGFGDTIQFCRFARWVADLGATVVLEVPSALARLLAGVDGVSQLLVRGAPLPPVDCHCPLMSLPLAFSTRLSTIPARVPYLSSDPAKVRYWRERLGAAGRPRVGLVWSGGFRPDQPELWTVNQRRNIPLAKLAPLRHCDVEFVSLQQGEQARTELAGLIERRWQGPAILELAGELGDFSDTAALMENLDLIISVDTSSLHVAGALGRPVWLLNRFDSCWRWLLDRTDSPWYPTLRIFRQPRAADWDGVIERVRAELLRFAADWTASRASAAASTGGFLSKA